MTGFADAFDIAARCAWLAFAIIMGLILVGEAQEK